MGWRSPEKFEGDSNQGDTVGAEGDWWTVHIFGCKKGSPSFYRCDEASCGSDMVSAEGDHVHLEGDPISQ